jgi:tRNA-Thr(GGU) m(6)t(6)A37 methyltransferase TsaA
MDDVPDQPYQSRAEGVAEIYSEFGDGLENIEGFSHLIILYLFHRVSERPLRLRSAGEKGSLGIFATRQPNRPSPIGLSVVRLVRRQDRMVWLYGVDMLDRTPIIDIKPYVPAFDRREGVSIGWMEDKVPKG